MMEQEERTLEYTDLQLQFLELIKKCPERR